jgi:arylsulfatase A-like enzyme
VLVAGFLVGTATYVATPSARATSEPDHPATARASHGRPNIVFITTDDQRLDDMRWMPITRRLLGGHGVTFTNALSPHPMCCPARAEFVTGQYGQNNGVHHNTGRYGGYHALRRPSDVLGHWLHKRGYQTAMVGKYLNGYHPDHASRIGWNHWNPSIRGVYSYDHTTFLNDGRRHLERGHVDDAVTDYATRYIREFSRKRAPFYVWASDLAPHVRALGGGRYASPLPARRHRHTMRKAVNPATRKPSYGVRIVHGPKPHIRTRRGLGPRMASRFEARIESLQAVDEGVRKIVGTLRRTGELANTYLVFTSDNGYLMGEHGLLSKNRILDEALRVPMIVRVPGVTRHRTSSVPVTSVDIAPTVVDLAGARAGRRVDGRSFAPLLSGRRLQWRDTQLVQTGRRSHSRADPGWLVRGVRTSRWTYGVAGRAGSVQLYDRANDPFELVNLARRAAYRPVIVALRKRTASLKRCAGASCRRDFGPEPTPEP